MLAVRATRWSAAVVLAVSLSACGGGEGPQAKVEESPVPSAGRNPARSTTTAVTVREQTVAVSKVFWYAGFKVTVKNAALRNGQLPYGGGPVPVVSVLANFENVGTDRDRFDAETVLQSAGRNHFKVGEGQDLPEVPGGANQDGTIVIVVDPTLRFDDAMLVVGSADTNQPRIPLTRAEGLVAFEPRALPLSGKLTTVSLVVDLRGGELRADTREPTARCPPAAGRSGSTTPPPSRAAGSRR